MYTLILMAPGKPNPYVYRYKHDSIAKVAVLMTVQQGDKSKEGPPEFVPIDGLKDSYTFEYRSFRVWLFSDKDVPTQAHPTMLIEIDDPDNKELT